MALSEIVGQQENPTEKITKRVNQFLDYMANNPDAKIRYHTSNMILQRHSNESYPTALKAQSRAGSHFFLGSPPKHGSPVKLNGTIIANWTILKCVATSAAKDELVALFLNSTEAKTMRLTIPSHPTPSMWKIQRRWVL